MKLNFRSLATLSGLFFFALALVWLLAPDLVLSDWGVEFSASVGLLGRRAAALYAGFAVMLVSARNAEPSTTRSALIKGVAAACLMLAALGLYELWAGHVTGKILIAVGIEVAFTLAFLSVSADNRTTSTRAASATNIKQRKSK